MKKERFTMPTDEELIEFAILVNNGRLDMKQLTNMVSMSIMVITRLYENGNIRVPAKDELK